jgi:hypothetical protein
MKIRFLAIALLTSVAACAGVPKGMEAGETAECRSLNVTGSRFPKTECKTVTEWAKYDADEKKRNEEMLIREQRGANPATM